MVAAVAVAIPTMLHAWLLLGDLERSVSEQNLELTRVVGSLMEQRVNQTILELELLARSPGFAHDVDLRNVSTMQQRLAHLVQLDAGLSSALIVDRQGVVWAHTLDDQRILSQDDALSPGVQEALRSGLPTLGQAFRSSVTGNAVVRIIVPFRDQSGVVVGALQGVLSLDRLSDLVEGARGAGRGRVAVYDAAGWMLAASDPDLILTRMAPGDTAVLAALQGEIAASHTVDQGGRRAFVAAIPLSQGWVVEASQPVDVARASLYGRLAQDGLIALMGIVAAALIGMVAAQRVAAPLVTLLRALRSIRQDESGPTLPHSNTAEISSLVDEVEAMRSALAARTAQTQDALRVLGRYRLLAEQMSDLVLFVERDGTIIEVNHAAERAYGYARADLIGRSFFEVFGGPGEHLHADELDRALRGGLRFETTHRRRDGSTFPAEVTLFGAEIDGHTVLISMTRDVTDRLRADEIRARMLLRERETRMREERAAEVMNIIQFMPCGVLVFDADGILNLANEQAMDMLSMQTSNGWAGREPAILHPTQLLDDRLLNPCRSLVTRALGGRAISGEELPLGAEGLRGQVVVGSAAPLVSPSGDVHGAVAVLVDVTRERRLVEELTASESTVRHSLASLLVLHEASQALTSTLVEEEIGRRLVTNCVRIARLDAALLFLDDGRGGVRLLSAEGDPIQIDHALNCESAGRIRLAARAETARASVTPILACTDGGMSEGSVMALCARGEQIGVLEIYGPDGHAAAVGDALASLAAHAVSALDNARLFREVGDREQRLQDALRQLLIAQEEERRRIAHDLHDGLAQVAAATHMSLQTFASHYRPRSPEMRQRLSRSLELAQRVVREARHSIAGLRPTTLDDFGLERAVRLHIQDLVSDGWTIEYHAELGPDRLPGPVETVLFRITQEALTNVRKHAQTLTAMVSLRRVEGNVELEVADQGAGFDMAAPTAEIRPGQHLGLVGMRERAGTVGGQCVIESRVGKGTRVTVRIPLGIHAMPVSADTSSLAVAGHVA
ncbi:MAG: PAS domain S-box protein [Chloroflexota bacterium]